MAIKQPAPMPGPDVPLVDPKTGRMDSRWYQYFKDNERAVRANTTVNNTEHP